MSAKGLRGDQQQGDGDENASYLPMLPGRGESSALSDSVYIEAASRSVSLAFATPCTFRALSKMKLWNHQEARLPCVRLIEGQLTFSQLA